MIFSAYTLYRYHAVQICQLVNHRVLLFVFPYLRLLGETIGTGRHRNSNSYFTVMSAGQITLSLKAGLCYTWNREKARGRERDRTVLFNDADSC